jgi:hypothetical protein
MTQIVKHRLPVEEILINSKRFIRLNFEAKLSALQAQEICDKLKKIYKINENNKQTMIFNSLEMQDYEPKARVIFQETLRELKSQIDMIWLISDSKIIVGGAAIMSLLTKIKIQTVKSEDFITV